MLNHTVYSTSIDRLKKISLKRHIRGHERHSAPSRRQSYGRCREWLEECIIHRERVFEEGIKHFHSERVFVEERPYLPAAPLTARDALVDGVQSARSSEELASSSEVCELLLSGGGSGGEEATFPKIKSWILLTGYCPLCDINILKQSNKSSKGWCLLRRNICARICTPSRHDSSDSRTDASSSILKVTSMSH